MRFYDGLFFYNVGLFVCRIEIPRKYLLWKERERETEGYKRVHISNEYLNLEKYQIKKSSVYLHHLAGQNLL